MIDRKTKKREIIDFYKLIENNPIFRQFSVDDLLFTAYDCPLEGSPVDYSTEKITFVILLKVGENGRLLPMNIISQLVMVFF